MNIRQIDGITNESPSQNSTYMIQPENKIGENEDDVSVVDENTLLHQIFDQLDINKQNSISFETSVVGLKKFSTNSGFSITTENWAQLDMLFHGPNLIGGSNLDFNQFSLFAREFKTLAALQEE